MNVGSLSGDGVVEAKGLDYYGQSGGGAIAVEHQGATGTVLTKLTSEGGHYQVGYGGATPGPARRAKILNALDKY